MKQIITIFTVIFALCAGSIKVMSSNMPEKPHAFIRPLPTGIDINNLTDATVSASFSTKDFGWMGGNLTMTIYAEQLYDTVDLHQLQVGDSILYS